MDEQRDQSPRDVILAALRLAKQRVTGELDAKEIRRERLSDLIIRAALYGDNPGYPERPTSADLAEVLGNPGDEALREAIGAWSQGDAPAAPDRDAPLPVRPQAGSPVTGSAGLG